MFLQFLSPFFDGELKCNRRGAESAEEDAEKKAKIFATNGKSDAHR